MFHVVQMMHGGMEEADAGTVPVSTRPHFPDYDVSGERNANLGM